MKNVNYTDGILRCIGIIILFCMMFIGVYLIVLGDTVEGLFWIVIGVILCYRIYTMRNTTYDN